MAFLAFGKKSRTVALIDITSSSIGGAYLALAHGKPPVILYTTRVPLEPHATEPLDEALPRTLEALLHLMATEGAVALRASAGTGHPDEVFVSLTSPWQIGSVHSKVIEKDKPFIFTHQVLSAASQSVENPPAGFTRMSDLVLATMLNGYEIDSPIGKKVNRAELFILSSSIQEDVLALVRKAVRKAFHTAHVDFAAFMSEAYAGLADLYPHQRDFMLIDIGNETTDTILVKHGLLVNVSSIPHGVGEITRAARGVGVSSPVVPMEGPLAPGILDTRRNTSFASKIDESEAAWLAVLRETLAVQASQEPLPRTVFLLAEESVRDFLRRLLDAPSLRTLWLTDEPLSAIPLTNQQFLSSVQAATGESFPPSIALLALAAQKRYDQQGT